MNANMVRFLPSNLTVTHDLDVNYDLEDSDDDNDGIIDSFDGCPKGLKNESK